jgi:hypothetical protein
MGVLLPLKRKGNGVAPAADGKLHESSSPHYHWPVLFNHRPHHLKKTTIEGTNDIRIVKV